MSKRLEERWGTDRSAALEAGHYFISDERMAEAHEIEARFAKRATKLGVKGFRLEVVESRDYNVVHVLRDWSEQPTGQMVRYHVVKLEGTAPKYDGWTMVAAIDHLPGEEVLVQAVPTNKVEIPASYRTTTQKCDHCHTTRNRNRTYILHNDDGRFAQIGSTCIADYLGVPVEDMIAWLQFEVSIGSVGDDQWAEGGGRGVSFVNPETFLLWVVRSMRANGWTSRTKARECGFTSTADDAISLAFPWSQKDEERSRQAMEDNKQFIEQDQAEVAEALAWTHELPRGDAAKSDYMHNLAVVASLTACPLKQVGILASLMTTYRRERGTMIERERRQHEDAKSEWIGQPKQRLSFEATVSFLKEFNGDYGTSTLIKMLDDNGNIIVWWAANLSQQVVQGERYAVKATIKAHDTYHGVKQTTVQRAVLTPFAPPPDTEPAPPVTMTDEEREVRERFPVDRVVLCGDASGKIIGYGGGHNPCLMVRWDESGIESGVHPTAVRLAPITSLYKVGSHLRMTLKSGSHLEGVVVGHMDDRMLRIKWNGFESETPFPVFAAGVEQIEIVEA
jgi:hypothetical protein